MKKSGFTLIELSIVLVIIGLIVGGVLVGRDLIAAAQIRAQIKQIEDFKTAANTFKLKYGALPGDIQPADAANLGFFTFTGPNAGKGSKPSVWYGFGNNNGEIENGEMLVFWQHLSQAGMINGQYGGGAGFSNSLEPDTTTTIAAGNPVNACSDNACLDMMYPTMKITSNYDNHLYVYGNHTVAIGVFYNNTSLANFFRIRASTYKQQAIDNKMDDGLPGSGTIRNEQFSAGSTPTNNTCVKLSTSNYVYNTTTDEEHFLLGGFLHFYCIMGIMW